MRYVCLFILISSSFIQAQNVVIGREAAPMTQEMVTDTFLFYDEIKGSFRSGVLQNSKNWAPDSTGFFSAAFGNNTLASGIATFAIGNNTKATGLNDFASGYQTIASGSASAAFGETSQASGVVAFASGRSKASGDYSFASGDSKASGKYSFSSGVFTEASGDFAFSSGFGSEASGLYASSFGVYCKARGNNSLAAGINNIAESYSEFAVGSYNTEYVANDLFDWNAEDRLFVVGNGQSLGNRSDAMVILKNGNTTINGRLGIRNSNPDKEFHVTGQAKIQAFGSGSDANFYMQSGTGVEGRVITFQKTT